MFLNRFWQFSTNVSLFECNKKYYELNIARTQTPEVSRFEIDIKENHSIRCVSMLILEMYLLHLSFYWASSFIFEFINNKYHFFLFPNLTFNSKSNVKKITILHSCWYVTALFKLMQKNAVGQSFFLIKRHIILS